MRRRKNPYSASVLNRSGSISKVYYAVTEGTPVPHEVCNTMIKWYEDNGICVIDAPIGRAEASVIRRRYAVTADALLQGILY